MRIRNGAAKSIWLHGKFENDHWIDVNQINPELSVRCENTISMLILLIY